MTPRTLRAERRRDRLGEFRPTFAGLRQDQDLIAKRRCCFTLILAEVLRAYLSGNHFSSVRLFDDDGDADRDFRRYLVQVPRSLSLFFYLYLSLRSLFIFLYDHSLSFSTVTLFPLRAPNGVPRHILPTAPMSCPLGIIPPLRSFNELSDNQRKITLSSLKIYWVRFAILKRPERTETKEEKRNTAYEVYRKINYNWHMNVTSVFLGKLPCNEYLGLEDPLTIWKLDG